MLVSECDIFPRAIWVQKGRIRNLEALAELKLFLNTTVLLSLAITRLPAMMSVWSELPFELVERIIVESAYDASPNPSQDYYDFAVDDTMDRFVRTLGPDLSAARAWVASLLLVSRRIRDLVQPILYETVTLTRRNLRRALIVSPASAFRAHTRYLVCSATLVMRERAQPFVALTPALKRFVQVQGFCGTVLDFMAMATGKPLFRPHFVILTGPGSLMNVCKAIVPRAPPGSTPLAHTRYLHMSLDGNPVVTAFTLSPSDLSSLALKHISIHIRGKTLNPRDIVASCRIIMRDAPVILEIPTLETLLVRIPLGNSSALHLLQRFARSQPERSAKFIIEEVDLFVRRGPEPESRRERNTMPLRVRQGSSSSMSPSSPLDFSSDTAFEEATETYPRAMFDPAFWQAGWSPPQRRLSEGMESRATDWKPSPGVVRIISRFAGSNPFSNS